MNARGAGWFLGARSFVLRDSRVVVQRWRRFISLASLALLSLRSERSRHSHLLDRERSRIRFGARLSLAVRFQAPPLVSLDGITALALGQMIETSSIELKLIIRAVISLDFIRCNCNWPGDRLSSPAAYRGCKCSAERRGRFALQVHAAK